MILWIDAQLSPALARWLSDTFGVTAHAVRDLGLRDAKDLPIFHAAREAGAVIMPEHLSHEIAASRRTIPASERILEPTEVIVRLDQPMAAAVQHLEQTMMQYALKKCGGRIEETATMLGLSRKGLYLKRLRFGIDPPQPVAAASA